MLILNYVHLHIGISSATVKKLISHSPHVQKVSFKKFLKNNNERHRGKKNNKIMFSIAETQKKIIECENQTLQANQLNCHEYDVLAEEIKLLSR